MAGYGVPVPSRKVSPRVVQTSRASLRTVCTPVTAVPTVGPRSTLSSKLVLHTYIQSARIEYFVPIIEKGLASTRVDDKYSVHVCTCSNSRSHEKQL